MADITITVDDKEIQAALTRVLNTLKNPKPVFEDIAQEMQSDIDDHFRKQEGSDGKWVPSQRALGQGTGKGKTRTGTTLRDTNFMYNSITSKKNRLATQNAAIVQTDVKYAPIHNFGGSIKFKKRKGSLKMLKREFMWLSSKGKKNIVQILMEHIQKKWSK